MAVLHDWCACGINVIDALSHISFLGESIVLRLDSVQHGRA